MTALAWGGVLRQIETWLQPQGLLIRAAFQVSAEDAVPALSNGVPARALLLIGNVGSSLWPFFSASPEYADDLPDALDRWSTRLGQQLAAEFGGMALFPFGGAPFHPFLRWARRGDPTVSSPLGLSLHPAFGLWHAYRFALALPENSLDTQCRGVAADEPDTRPEDARVTDSAATSLRFLCSDCEAQPCLSACPVSAFTGTDYHHLDCARFLSETPDHPCNHQGCAARRACPVGQAYCYQPEHAQFHMKVFVDLHGGSHG